MCGRGKLSLETTLHIANSPLVCILHPIFLLVSFLFSVEAAWAKFLVQSATVVFPLIRDETRRRVHWRMLDK